MKKTLVFLGCCALAVLLLGSAGCEQKQDGPAAEAGKKIDEMVQGKGPAEQAGEKIDQFMDDAGKALDEAGEKIKKSTEK